jgi:hypothetical protein
MLPPDAPPPLASPAPRDALRVALYASQIADSVLTSAALKQCGREAFPLMRPFSHGGVAMYVVGFALLDGAIHLALRRTKLAKTAEAVALGASVVGLGMDGLEKCPH